MTSSRKLAAIMFSDIQGYTALMQSNETTALAWLEEYQSALKKLTSKYQGEIVKEYGDGTICLFDSALHAISCACDLQVELQSNTLSIPIRIGLHSGDVIHKNNDVYGDALNITSRIESMGVSGSILISDSLVDRVKNQPNFGFKSMGKFHFKNVKKVIEVYAVTNEGIKIPHRKSLRGKFKNNRLQYLLWSLLPLIVIAIGIGLKFNKKQVNNLSQPIEFTNSIAVLPFVNMSSDPEQEYFSDGMSEEIINMLAQAPGLKVTGRTSSFAFKGKNIDLTEIGEKLKVNYILEGSVRKSGDILRITAQLIKTSDGFHLFSQNFNRKLDDVFAIQDEVSLSILNAIQIKLLKTDKEAILKRYTSNIEAYELYLKGRFYYNQYTPEGMVKAIDFFKDAITIEPDYSIAYSGMAYCYQTLWHWNWKAPKESISQATTAANRAIETDTNNAESYLALGRLKLHYEWKIEEALSMFSKSLSIYPSNAECFVQLGICHLLLGNNSEALRYANQAMELDPMSVMNLWMASIPVFSTGNAERAMEIANRMIELDPNFFGGHLNAGLAHAMKGNVNRALEEITLACNLEQGGFTLGELGKLYARVGENVKAQNIIDRIKEIQGFELTGNNFVGNIYLAMGDLEKAFHYFNKAVENHEGNMLWTIYSFNFSPELLKDPRATELLEEYKVFYSKVQN